MGGCYNGLPLDSALGKRNITTKYRLRFVGTPTSMEVQDIRVHVERIDSSFDCKTSVWAPTLALTYTQSWKRRLQYEIDRDFILLAV